ncbi:MAG TPA: histidine ammonia-lyase [Saprospiraceae bacterium]|jgi:histidine ammonia-lyase|nr:histidine ammonia-lyase [Saprospiraceae bacterium]HRO08021.1 histidine ammonia-lyase [Saprospiraceae bacterium]HRP41392.1 histidine ammonia-lyase [Saprospiraceae bacterium]
MSDFIIDGTIISPETIKNIITLQQTISLSDSVKSKITANRSYLEQKLSNPDTIIYGINTGFGSLCNVRVDDKNLGILQENLVRSHACGMGEKVPQEISRLIHLLKIINLAHGYSGIRLELLQKLTDIYNSNIVPVIYQQGSLGASGDLAPLAHLSLPLLGEGTVWYKNEEVSASEALKMANITPIELKSKEGLALLNGTQFSLAYATDLVTKAEKLIHIINKVSALSMDAYLCDIAPFNHLLHDIRPHKGQQLTAKAIFDLLSKSELRHVEKQSIQDPYSFRCVPQVHGASWTAIQHAKDVIHTEINAATDNPMVFDKEDVVLSGGNFHAQPLALVLDYLAIALAELGNISERRVYQLINGDRGLPAFLTKYPGLDSGFMIVQYTAASIVSQSKQYCTPASVDSIVSSKGQEDHVSMAANAATKCAKVMDNLISLIAIELLTAGQALEFRRPSRSCQELESMFAELRAEIPVLEQDRIMHTDMVKAVALVKSWI